MTADFEPIRRRIADHAIRLSPIVNHAEVGFRTKRKKFIQSSGDHDIQIQKQRRAAQSRKFARPQR